MPLGLLGAASGAGGLNPASSSGAAGGTAESGRNVIAVGGFPMNLEAIVNAVQAGGSSRAGGVAIQQPSYLGPMKSTSGVNLSLPGFDAGLNVSPVVIIGALAALFIVPRLLKK